MTDPWTLSLGDKVYETAEHLIRDGLAMVGTVTAVQRRRSRALVEWPNGVTSWHATKRLTLWPTR